VTTAGKLILVLAAAAMGPACIRAQARTPAAEPPPLDVPAPPGRVIIPVTVKVPEPPPPVVEPDEPPPARPPATSGGVPTRPPERTSPPASSSQPPPVLQTTSNTAAIEQRVRTLVAQARGNLARLDRSKLLPNARDQYDTAQRFIQMAEENLTIKNHLYAQQLAESAAALAGGLVKGEPATATGT
jgi:hypothetical protein